MKKVLIVFGGNSTEHYISCLSAKTIIKHIDRNIFDVTIVGITPNNEWYIFEGDINLLKSTSWVNSKNKHKILNIIEFLKKYDIVFPLTHGNFGEDGKLQGFLDLFNIKYVGSKTAASAVGMDKSFSKAIFQSINIPQVPYLVINPLNYSIKKILKNINFPLMVKPANGGSSIGISKVKNIKQLKKAIKKAAIYDKKIIIEKFIKARELECSIIKDKKIQISTIGEIIPANEFYDYNSKYNNNKSKLIIPAQLQKSTVNKIKAYANAAYQSIDCAGYARVDFFYDEKNNQIYLNEINTIPGFTEISMFPKLLMEDYKSLKEIITILIKNA